MNGVGGIARCFLFSGLLFLVFFSQKVVEAGANHRNGGELGNLFLRRVDGGRKNIRAELKFEGEGQIARQNQANSIEIRVFSREH